MVMALLAYRQVHQLVRVFRGEKSTVMVGVLRNPGTQKPEGIALDVSTGTESRRISFQNQETESFRRMVSLVADIIRPLSGRQRAFCDSTFDDWLHDVWIPQVFDHDLQLALLNDIHSLPQSKATKLKSELANLKYKNENKLHDFFEEYSDITIRLVTKRQTFTPWKGSSREPAFYRLLECSYEYINPPEGLITIGYLGCFGGNVVMVGIQSGRVYMDEDMIVYIVAESLSEFADHGCRKDPEFYDYYEKRPKTQKSLTCSAGTFKDEPDEEILEDDEDYKWTLAGHDPEKFNADCERAEQDYAKVGKYFRIPSTVS